MQTLLATQSVKSNTSERQTMNIFQRIIAKEIPADIVFEDDDIIAIKDVNPQARIHILLIPKEHISSLAAALPDQTNMLGGLLLAAAKVANKVGIDTTGYRVIVNVGDDAGLTVNQLHLHLIGGEPLGPLNALEN